MAIDIKEILANGLLDLCHKKDLSQITVKDLLETTGVSRICYSSGRSQYI